MKKFYLLAISIMLFFSSMRSNGQIAISAMMPNSAGTDSAYEYVQLIATQNIDFSATPYSLVVLNNGIATVKGWANGMTISYKFNLTSGIVHTGDVFYVGGSSKKINGKGSTDLSGEIWIRDINTVTTAGDGFGSPVASGVFGNAGGNADAAGIFAGTTIDSTTVPLDAIFFGSGIGTAYSAGPPVKGYQVPTNDLYNHTQGLFGAGTNTYYSFFRNLSDTLLSYSGTYDTITETWTTPRTPVFVKLTAASPISDIHTNITLVGNPVGIKDADPLKQVEIYPNPTSGLFNVSNPTEENIRVEVYDMLGNRIYMSTESEKNLRIDLGGKSKGVYFVQVSVADGSRQTVKKLVVK